MDAKFLAYYDSTSKSRLTVAYNPILRYVYGIRKYDGISQDSKLLYGVELIDLLKIKALILLHKIIYTQVPSYLFNRIQFATSNRGKQIIQLKHRTLISDWHSSQIQYGYGTPYQTHYKSLAMLYNLKKMLFSHF